MTGPWCWTNRVGCSLLQRRRNGKRCCSHPGKPLVGHSQHHTVPLSVRSKVSRPLQTFGGVFTKPHSANQCAIQSQSIQSQSNHTPWGTQASTLSIQHDIFASTARASTMHHTIYRLATQGAIARLAAARLDAGASVVGVPEPNNLTHPSNLLVGLAASTLCISIPDLLMFSKSIRLLPGNQRPPPAFHPPSPPNTTSAFSTIGGTNPRLSARRVVARLDTRAPVCCVRNTF